MARGVNKVVIIGNLGADPEIRYMTNGKAVASLSVATSESWKDRESGEQQERTEWHRVSLFARLAEIAGEYLRKGSKVYIEGSLRTRKWTDQNGVDRYSTEIIGNNMQMLDSRGGSAGFAPPAPDFGAQDSFGAPAPAAAAQPGFAKPAPSAAPQATATATAPSNKTQETAPLASASDFDDDIPF